MSDESKSCDGCEHGLGAWDRLNRMWVRGCRSVDGKASDLCAYRKADRLRMCIDCAHACIHCRDTDETGKVHIFGDEGCEFEAKQAPPTAIRQAKTTPCLRCGGTAVKYWLCHKCRVDVELALEGYEVSPSSGKYRKGR